MTTTVTPRPPVGARRPRLLPPSLLIGAALVLLVLLGAFVARLVTPFAPEAITVSDRLSAPGGSHPLGTDNFGRDLLSRLASGTLVSAQIAVSVVVIVFVLGLLLGLLAATVRPLDQLVMRICDGLLSVPGVLLALAAVAVLGASVPSLVFCIAVVELAGIVRLVRASALGAREQVYVEGASVAGVRFPAVVGRYILPQVLGPLFVQASSVFGGVIIIEAALSFLGAGIPAPGASLGNLLSESKNYIYTGWWLTLFPGLALAALVLGANLLGDGLATLIRVPRAARRHIRLIRRREPV